MKLSPRSKELISSHSRENKLIHATDDIIETMIVREEFQSFASVKARSFWRTFQRCFFDRLDRYGRGTSYITIDLSSFLLFLITF